MKKLFKSKRDDDDALIQNLIDGDPAAFEHVVAEYHNLMLSVARAIVGSSIADEVAQEAWISAIKALPKFEGRSSLKTWLIQIVSNGAKSRVRRENR
ncbi:MAG: RNA polymerase sigma-70 factor (ECF subfamily), partial [Candidatus Endobugula sp.]